MKFSFLLLSCFVSSVALAGPTVGDSATYTITSVDSGTTTVMTMMDQISTINNDAQTIDILQSVSQNGKMVDSQTNTSPFSDVLYPSDADINNCQSQNQDGQTAKIETITVAAGTFKTCHVSATPDSIGTINDIWLGAVPFGFVKTLSVTQGQAVTLELNSFVRH